MARWEDWQRTRHNPDTPPDQYQQSLARKVLGELMESIQRGGLFQNKITRRFADGTVVIAQYDGTTPMVEVINPQPQPSPTLGCTPLLGLIGTAHALDMPVDAVVDALRFTAIIPYDKYLYFLTPPFVWQFDPTTRVFTPQLQNGGWVPGRVNAASGFGYRSKDTKKIRLVMQNYDDHSLFHEFEMGTGWLEPYTPTFQKSSDSIPFTLQMQPGVINASVPVWRQLKQCAVVDNGGNTHRSALGYDFIARQWLPRVSFEDPLVYGSSGYLDGATYSPGAYSQAGYIDPGATPGLVGTGSVVGIRNASVARRALTHPVYPVPGLAIQICGWLYVAGSMSPAKNLESNEMVQFDMKSGAVRSFGQVPWDIPMTYTNDDSAATYARLVAMTDGAYLFYATGSPGTGGTWQVSGWQMRKIT